jgi:hypothetical protein
LAVRRLCFSNSTSHSNKSSLIKITSKEYC